jgi:hypothetical protein
MDIERSFKPTMTPFELNGGDRLLYTRGDGGRTTIELVDTDAYVLEKDYGRYGYGGAQGDISVYGFGCLLRVDGQEVEMRREVGSQASFYEPLAVAGVHLWLDAVKCIFDTSFDHGGTAGGFMVEKDFLGGHVCMPRQAARFVVQDAGASICPEPMTLWCDLPSGAPRITDCYNGEDCWMGPYGGAFAHCGLDINMPAGSRLHAPISFDTHHYHTSLTAGFNNNRWHGLRQWEHNSIWRLSASHLIDLLVPEYTELARGTAYATTAGTAVGAHEHTHFNLHVTEQGGSYFLDPWILFWQMLRDREQS